MRPVSVCMSVSKTCILCSRRHGTRLTYVTVGLQSPKLRTRSVSTTDGKPTLQTISVIQDSMSNPFETMDFGQIPIPNTTTRRVDLDGMTVMTGLDPAVEDLSMSLDLERVDEDPEEGNMFDVPDSPATAAFAPLLNEIFGPGWRCPSPVILHFGNAPTETTNPSPNNSLCPIWKKSNEMFGKVFNHRPGTAALNVDSIEAGLLYLGIKQGWGSFNEWMQSPVLNILKEVDEFLFCHQPKMDRLAAAYKSFKLLKVSQIPCVKQRKADSD
jgi:hypothetical protein